MPKSWSPPRASHSVSYVVDCRGFVDEGRSAQVGGQDDRAGLRQDIPPLLGAAVGADPHLWGLTPSCGGVPGQTGTRCRGAGLQPCRSNQPPWPRVMRELRELGPGSVDGGTCRPGIEPRNQGHSWVPTRSSQAASNSGETAMVRCSRTWRGRTPWHARKQCVRDQAGPAPGLVHRNQTRTANQEGARP